MDPNVLTSSEPFQLSPDMILGLLGEISNKRDGTTPFMNGFCVILHDHPVVRASRERTLGPER